jgi:hypothetical protein
MNILDLFFALRPENRPLLLDSEYHPRMRQEPFGLERSGLNTWPKSDYPREIQFKLPSGWKIGDPF